MTPYRTKAEAEKVKKNLRDYELAKEQDPSLSRRVYKNDADKQEYVRKKADERRKAKEEELSSIDLEKDRKKYLNF